MRTQDDRQIRRQFKQSSPIIRLDHLQPFFKFVNLTLFRFSVASLYELDNTAYSAFAQAWSQIRSFEVGQGKLCVHLQPPAVREVLVPFAIHCPKLVHLSVRFSGRNMDVLANGGIENPIPQGTHNTSVVKTLNCFDSSIAEAPRVAAFLALIFPKLKEVVWKESRDGMVQPGESWEEVKRYLPLFVSVREDGRRREAERQEQQRSP